ncbi:MAG: AAA family ATPase [Verrucomicrobiales bacterium]
MKEQLASLHRRLTSTVLGAEEEAYWLIVALLAHGHVLIQGAPGIGKTTLAHTLATGIDGSFKRVQFTPDLLPSDILGYSLFHQGRGEFQFIPGPVFANIVLADEINRTNPRIQSALLECMNERQVTIDGVTRPLASPFVVMATQNTLYATGTFPLPEPQLDRFLISLTPPTPDAQLLAKILAQHAARPVLGDPPPLLTAAEVSALQTEVLRVPAAETITSYIASLAHAVKKHEGLRGGLSPRAAIALLRAAQAVAWLEGHAAVHPDDVKRAVLPVWQHRLPARDTGDSGGTSPRQWLEHLLKVVPVP